MKPPEAQEAQDKKTSKTWSVDFLFATVVCSACIFGQFLILKAHWNSKLVFVDFWIIYLLFLCWWSVFRFHTKLRRGFHEITLLSIFSKNDIKDIRENVESGLETAKKAIDGLLAIATILILVLQAYILLAAPHK